MQQDSGVPSIAKLNVGGHYFTISLQTLTKDRNSMLGVMFSEKFDMKPAEDDAFFIDRDGTHFRFILNYLRTGKLTLPQGVTALNELQEEAEFYRIKGMLDELEFNSEILTNNEHRDLLLGWLPPRIQRRGDDAFVCFSALLEMAFWRQRFTPNATIRDPRPRSLLFRVRKTYLVDSLKSLGAVSTRVL